MSFTIRSTAQIVRGYAAAVQAAASTSISFVVGSLELARANAVAGVVMWLQSKMMALLALTRASTSTGSDLDSWLADFDIVTREGAVAAVGPVTMSRVTATNQAVIYPGVTLKTADGTQSFTVVADTSQSAWSATLNAYVVPAGTPSVSVTVEAVTAGTAGNVNANTITQIASAIPGIDSVTNPAAFTTGVNEETDPAVLTRFQQELQSLRSGIAGAAYSAIDALQQGIQRAIVENETLAGAQNYGYFYVVIYPYTSALQASVYSAVNATRPLSVVMAVFAAPETAADVALSVTAAAGYTLADVEAAVQTAIENFIGTIPLGSGLSWSQLYSVAWGVAGVATATGLLVNGGTADIAAVANTKITAGTVTVS